MPRIGRKRDGLWLNRRVHIYYYEILDGQELLARSNFNRFFQKGCQPISAEARPPARKWCGIDRWPMLHEFKAAKPLPIGGLYPSIGELLIADVECRLEIQQSDHNSRVDRRTPIGITENGLDFSANSFPVKRCPQLNQRMIQVDRIGQSGCLTNPACHPCA